MPAINILRRYLERKINGGMVSIPRNHSGLRQHIAAVASQAGIAITEEEAGELARCFLSDEDINTLKQAHEKPVKRRAKKKGARVV